jgi:alanine racemase
MHPSAYTHITIHADRVRNNVQQCRETLPPLTQIMAILKADAYGLGAQRMADILGDTVDALGVVTVSEAMALRETSKVPLILFSEPLPDEDILSLVADPKVVFTVYSEAFLRRLSDMAMAMARTVSIHLKVNTGLNRLGFSPDRLQAILSHIQGKSWLEVAGIFTHLGFSDHEGHPETAAQLGVFDTVVSEVHTHGFPFAVAHTLSTNGIHNVSGYVYDAVRIGLGLYRDAVTISAPVGYVREIQPGEWVSYDGLYRAQTPHKVGVIYAGYSAGIPSDTQGMSVLIHGQRYPVIGRICMDLVMVALPQASTIAIGDTAVLYGGEGASAITAADWNLWAGMNPREIFCRFGYRATVSVI